MATMYCVKCRAKRDDANAKEITMKNGKPAVQGVCPVCGTNMFKIGRAKYSSYEDRKNPTLLYLFK